MHTAMISVTFFPLVAVAYYLSKNRVYRNVVLLLASLLFYSWGEPRFLLLMLAATLAAYCGGLLPLFGYAPSLESAVTTNLPQAAVGLVAGMALFTLLDRTHLAARMKGEPIHA